MADIEKIAEDLSANFNVYYFNKHCNCCWYRN